MEYNELTCAIIGAGPAGYTAAVYMGRAGIKAKVFTGMQPGGQLTTTTEVENFPGFESGITGPELMDKMMTQATSFGAEIHYDMIDRVVFDYANNKHLLEDSSGTQYLADTVIIATGSKSRMLGIESERAFFGAGVSTCATCDGFFYKDKDAVVIGAGDTAAEEALYLSNICKVVHILVRKDKMRAAQYLQDRILKTSNIVLHFSTEVEQFLGDSTLKGVMTNKGYIINAEAAFIAIGHEPNTKLFENTNLLIDREHYTIVKNSANTLTNIAGVFACGDVADHTYRQAVVAAGDGARAAIDAQRYMLTR